MPRLNLTLNARLQPMHRHDIEDQLDEHFAGLPFQVETDGGGTGIAENGETEYCDIGLISEHSSLVEPRQKLHPRQRSLVSLRRMRRCLLPGCGTMFRCWFATHLSSFC